MVNKVFVGLGLMFTLTMYSDKPTTTQDLVDNVGSIEALYKNAKQIEIPISLTKDKWQDLYEEFLNTYRLGPQKLPTYLPCVRVAGNKTFDAYIFVSPKEPQFSELRTVDKKGNQIDDLQLLGIWTGDSPVLETSEVTTLNADLTIRIAQDRRYYELDSNGDRINSGKMRTSNFLYQILESGRIKRLQ